VCESGTCVLSSSDRDGTGGLVMDHGAARSDSRCCLLHPGELVIGRTDLVPT